MAHRTLLAVNAGSSSIKYALYAIAGTEPRRIEGGRIASIAGATSAGASTEAYLEASETILRRLGEDTSRLEGVGHRVVHSGLGPLDHQRITGPLLERLRTASPLDPDHLPAELALIQFFHQQFPDVPQVACFDTAFHRKLPRLAQLLPIPRRYDAMGLRRLGFHGLSYAYLMEALARVDRDESRGRVVLAHLGSGASLAAVRDGQPVDTSMAFTPAAGIVMATRPGDLDPGLLTYLLRNQGMNASGLDDLVSHRSGLLGVSGTTGDMEELLRRRSGDPHAAEAVDLFCYQARKWVGAFCAVLGGLDTLVFSGGIGERAPAIRAGICEGLDFLGLRLDAAGNASNAPVISSPESRVTVRVIPTDEEQMIARSVLRVLGHGPDSRLPERVPD